MVDQPGSNGAMQAAPPSGGGDGSPTSRPEPNFAPVERVLELTRDLMRVHARTLDLLKDA